MGERSHPRVAILSYFVTQQPMWPPFVGKPVKNRALIITGLESGNDDASTSGEDSDLDSLPDAPAPVPSG